MIKKVLLSGWLPAQNIIFYSILIVLWSVAEIGEFAFCNLIVTLSSTVAPVWQDIELQKIQPQKEEKLATIITNLYLAPILVLLTISLDQFFEFAWEEIVLIPLGISFFLASRYHSLLLSINCWVRSRYLMIVQALIQQLSILYVFFFSSSVLTAVFVGYCLSIIVIMLDFVVFFYGQTRHRNIFRRTSLSSEKLLYRLKLYFSHSSSVFIGQADRIFLSYVGIETLGLYTMISKPYEIISGVARTYLSMHVRESYADSTNNYALGIMGFLAALMVLGILIISILKLDMPPFTALGWAFIFLVCFSLFCCCAFMSYHNIFSEDGMAHSIAKVIGSVVRVVTIVPTYLVFGIFGLPVSLFSSLLIQLFSMIKMGGRGTRHGA